MIIGYQVVNKDGNHWNDRYSFLILDEKTAIADLEESKKSDTHYFIVAILKDDIEEPTFEGNFIEVESSHGYIMLNEKGEVLYVFMGEEQKIWENVSKFDLKEHADEYNLSEFQDVYDILELNYWRKDNVLIEKDEFFKEFRKLN